MAHLDALFDIHISVPLKTCLFVIDVCAYSERELWGKKR